MAGQKLGKALAGGPGGKKGSGNAPVQPKRGNVRGGSTGVKKGTRRV